MRARSSSRSAKFGCASRTNDLNPQITSVAHVACSMTGIADLQASSGSRGFA